MPPASFARGTSSAETRACIGHVLAAKHAEPQHFGRRQFGTKFGIEVASGRLAKGRSIALFHLSFTVTLLFFLLIFRVLCLRRHHSPPVSAKANRSQQKRTGPLRARSRVVGVGAPTIALRGEGCRWRWLVLGRIHCDRSCSTTIYAMSCRHRTTRRRACQPCAAGNIVTIFARSTTVCLVASARGDAKNRLEIPALGVCDEKVAEDLQPGDIFEFFRIDEIGVERDRVGLGEYLHEPGFGLDKIVGQHGNADAMRWQAAGPRCC